MTKPKWEVVYVAGVPIGIGEPAGKQGSYKMLCNPIKGDLTPQNVKEIAAALELMAAAPDLLAACESVLKSLTQPGAKGNPSISVTLKQLRAAVAKARPAP